MLTSQKYLIAGLLLLFALVYSPTYKTPFIMDDSHTIQSNQFVHSLNYFFLPWTSAKAYSSSPENYGYRPLTANFNQLCWFFGNGNVIAFQVAKKLLFALFAWCCFLLWNQWFRLLQSSQSQNLWWGHGCLAFAFFLFHPVGTQVANYIAASSTLLCGLFYVLSLYFYLKFRSTEKNWMLALSGLCYFLSVMSKEEGITLIAILVIIELFFLRPASSLESKAANKYPLMALAFLTGIALVATALIVAHFEPTSDIARGSVSRGLYFATQLRAYLFYISTYFWPFQFNFDNLSFQFATTLWTATNAVFFFINAVLVGLGLILCGRKSPYGLAIVGFYIAILPASSIIPLAEAVNDHRHFIPFIFFGFGMVHFFSQNLPRIVKNKTVEKITIGTLLLSLAAATYTRNLDFISNKTIWADTVLKNPDSPRANNNLALEYMAVADYAVAKELLSHCITVGVSYYPCFINYAVTSAATGDDVTAENYFTKAILMDSNKLSSRLFYADFLMRKRRDAEAKKYLDEANEFAQGLNKPVLDRLETLRSRGLAGQ